VIGLVLAVACVAVPTCSATRTTNCATPTPMVAWDGVESDMLAGYRVYSRVGGQPMVLAATLPCEWADLDEDGVFETRNCRGASFAVPIQRFNGINPGTSYELAIKAVDLLDRESLLYSNPIYICAPPLYVIGSRAPYN